MVLIILELWKWETFMVNRSVSDLKNEKVETEIQ